MSEIPSIQDILAASRTALPAAQEAELSLDPVAGGGSDRCYFRLRGLPPESPGIIVMAYTDARADNPMFFPATSTLETLGVAVPRIFGHDSARRLAWVEDMGETGLWDLREETWEVRRPCYEATLAEVAKLHRTRPGDLETAQEATLMEPFDEGLYLWEQGYFLEHLVEGMCGLDPVRSGELRESPGLLELAAGLAKAPRSLVHRDFQSQNVILAGPDRRPVLIDYQGLRWGLPEYDLASLLYDPYVTFPEGQRERLAEIHHGLLDSGESFERFALRLRRCAIQRLMQALGAYANLGRNLGKPRFFQHIPPAMDSLLGLVAEEEALQELAGVLEEIRGGLGS